MLNDISFLSYKLTHTYQNRQKPLSLLYIKEQGNPSRRRDLLRNKVDTFQFE